MVKRLFIVDAMAMAYRNFYALGRLNTSEGKPVSAVFGSAMFMMKILATEKPDYLVVASDSQAKTFRHDLYKDYKANRKAMPEELASQLPDFYRLFAAMGLPVLKEVGLEADDFIGSVARKFAAPDLHVFIVSGDKDFMQLVDDRTFIYAPRKGEDAAILGTAGVAEKFSCTPNRVIDVLALMGDASDNIPGVTGIGEKGAAKLIEAYGSLEGVYANLDKITAKKQRENLESDRSNAILSKTLVTIRTDCDLGLTLPELACDSAAAVSREDLLSFFENLQFRALSEKVRASIGARIGARTATSLAGLGQAEGQDGLASANLPGDSAAVGLDDGEVSEGKGGREVGGGSEADRQEGRTSGAAPDVTAARLKAGCSYPLVNNRVDLEGLVRLLCDVDIFSFDTETTGLDVVSDRPIGVSFSAKEGQAFYVPLLAAHLDHLSPEGVCEALKTIFAAKAIKVAHNLKFDYQMLTRIGIVASGPFADSMLLHYLLDPDYRRHGLDDCCLRYLGFRKIPAADLIGAKGDRPMAEVPLAVLADYAGEDADYTLRLYKVLMADLASQDTAVAAATNAAAAVSPAAAIVGRNLAWLFWNVEMPLVPILAQIEQSGIYVAPGVLMGLSARLAIMEEELRQIIHGLAGEEFNIASPKQLQKILFEKLRVHELLGIKRLKKTKDGFSTDASVLAKLAAHPIVGQLLEYRSITKLKGTYVDPLPQLIHPETERIHASFHQTGTATGRLSSSEPNLQNIPIRSDLGKEIRQAFRAQKAGHVILSADYSQIELRLLAHLSADDALLAAFRSGEDIHRATAAQVFGVLLSEVTQEMRGRAKAVNYGIVYGMGPKRLAEAIGSSVADAAEFIARYFAAYPQIRRYLEQSVVLAMGRGYTETLCGRRRYVPDLDSKNEGLAAAARNAAVNSPLQGSAADLIKIAMIRIQAGLSQRTLGAIMLAQVHDELLFEVPFAELAETTAVIREGMEGALELQVPLVVDIGTGDDWLAAH